MNSNHHVTRHAGGYASIFTYQRGLAQVDSFASQRIQEVELAATHLGVLQQKKKAINRDFLCDYCFANRQGSIM